MLSDVALNHILKEGKYRLTILHEKCLKIWSCELINVTPKSIEFAPNCFYGKLNFILNNKMLKWI